MDPNTQWIDNRKLKYILGLSVAFPHALQGDRHGQYRAPTVCKAHSWSSGETAAQDSAHYYSYPGPPGRGRTGASRPANSEKQDGVHHCSVRHAACLGNMASRPHHHTGQGKHASSHSGKGRMTHGGEHSPGLSTGHQGYSANTTKLSQVPRHRNWIRPDDRSTGYQGPDQIK